MARDDWYYASIPMEMARMFDSIVELDGRKYGVTDRLELIRAVLAEFLASYEQSNNFMIAVRNASKWHNKERNPKDRSDDGSPVEPKKVMLTAA